MPNKKIPDLFDVQVYGNITELTPTVSKARCRVFYKYENRNGGYITDEFAEKLLSTIPYAPVKGIYNPDEGDYDGHGFARTEGKIYGVVMADPNVSWEKHTDVDGATREYACVDVLLFTALYPVAKTIVGKSQSMELYSDSIKGEWKHFGENCYFVYEDACFLGLQVLGDEVEPCFEGSAFFSLADSVQELIEQVKKFSLMTQQNEGGTTMPEDKILEEEAVEEVAEEIAEVEEAEVIEEVAEETDAPENHELDEAEEEAVEESAEEPAAEEEEVAEEDTESSDEELENVESAEDNATLETENDFSAEVEAIKEELAQATAKIAELEAENAELKEFKLGVETLKKTEILESYEEMLSEETIDSYSAKLNEFSAEDLDKELAYEVKKSNSGIFAKMPETDAGIIPNGEPEVSGLEGLLSKYKK